MTNVVLYSEPFKRFNIWLAEAEKKESCDPTAMSLATATAEGQPDVRMMLLKGVDEQGFVFYTNTDSTKAKHLASNPRAALCFHWKSLHRQVRVEGRVIPVSDKEADAYFSSRPRLSRIGAWASKQSYPLKDRFELEKRVAIFSTKYPIGSIPRPKNWSGYRVVPEKIEFWENRPFRLHERIVYNLVDSGWATVNLFP